MKMKTSKAVILTIIAVLLAIYILFPFALVVLNSFKNQAAIVNDPISTAGASFKQFASNLSAVVNNKNFVFWHAFGSSAIVTIISLVLLAVLGGMSAWVICRNKTKWSTVIYMTFISSMKGRIVSSPIIRYITREAVNSTAGRTTQSRPTWRYWTFGFLSFPRYISIRGITHGPASRPRNLTCVSSWRDALASVRQASDRRKRLVANPISTRSQYASVLDDSFRWAIVENKHTKVGVNINKLVIKSLRCFRRL